MLRSVALTKLPPGGVIKRLRQLGQPVTLFGETADERIRRLACMIRGTRARATSGCGGHEITEAKETKEEKEEDGQTTSRDRSWIKARLKAREAALESRSDGQALRAGPAQDQNVQADQGYDP